MWEEYFKWPDLFDEKSNEKTVELVEVLTGNTSCANVEEILPTDNLSNPSMKQSLIGISKEQHFLWLQDELNTVKKYQLFLMIIHLKQ